MADFTIIIGTQRHLIPQAFDVNNNPVPFPSDAAFTWTSSDPNLAFSDATSASPDLTATGVVTGAIISFTVNYTIGGETKSHSAAHTWDSVEAPTDPIDHVDYTA